MPDESAKKVFASETANAGKASEKPQYTLDELLAQCSTSEPLSEEERTWIDSPSLGKEML
jgi:antitoxin component of MazEF toxin-antitoxin module